MTELTGASPEEILEAAFGVAHVCADEQLSGEAIMTLIGDMDAVDQINTTLTAVRLLTRMMLFAEVSSETIHEALRAVRLGIGDTPIRWETVNADDGETDEDGEL